MFFPCVCAFAAVCCGSLLAAAAPKIAPVLTTLCISLFRSDSDMKLVYGRASVVAETMRLKRKQLHDQMSLFRPCQPEGALRAMHAALSAKHMTPHQLFAWFMERDVDGSGTMERAEFDKCVMEDLNLGLTEPQLEQLAKVLDRDGNGDVCYGELTQALNFNRDAEGRARRKSIAERSAYLRRTESAPVRVSMSSSSSAFTKSLPYEPFARPASPPERVPPGGGRYATAREARRMWYGPEHRVYPLPAKLMGGSSSRTKKQPMHSRPRPAILYRGHRRNPPRSPTPSFLNKNAASLPATNFFSGMLGQRSLDERMERRQRSNSVLNQRSALPETDDLSPSSILPFDADQQEQRGRRASSESRRSSRAVRQEERAQSAAGRSRNPAMRMRRAETQPNLGVRPHSHASSRRNRRRGGAVRGSSLSQFERASTAPAAGL